MKLTEILNIYDLHDNPSKLKGDLDQASEKVPGLAWKKYYQDRIDRKYSNGYLRDLWFLDLREREHLWAKDPEIAMAYATGITGERFPAGEPAIMSGPDWIKNRYDEVFGTNFLGSTK